MNSNPWTSFLEWLQSLIVPEWNSLIAMLPLLVIVGLVGPILSLIMLMHMWHLWHQRKGRVRIAELEPVSAPLGPDGDPLFPANKPFCVDHAVIYPPNTRACEIDGEELAVRCPIDETSRPATQELCRGCGTRYVLGASRSAVTVRRTGRPPEGGAAVA